MNNNFVITYIIGKGEKVTSLWSQVFSDPIMTFTLFLVLFTLALVIVGAYQASQLKKTIVTMKESSERQIRAYVGIADIKIPLTYSAISSDATTRTITSAIITIMVQNGGQTPANNLTAHINFHRVPFGENLPLDFTYPDYNTVIQTKSKSSLIPSRKTTFSIPIDTNVVAEAYNDLLFLYIYGKISYTDIFGINRETTYCFRYDPKNNMYIIQEKHNDLL